MPGDEPGIALDAEPGDERWVVEVVEVVANPAAATASKAGKIRLQNERGEGNRVRMPAEQERIVRMRCLRNA
jgi:hypothetical protein